MLPQLRKLDNDDVSQQELMAAQVNVPQQDEFEPSDEEGSDKIPEEQVMMAPVKSMMESQ